MYRYLSALRNSHFNSIKVRLERLKSIFVSLHLCNFNSIKVRLELTNSFCLMVCIFVFQFHKGTIRTRTEIMLLRDMMNFNSIKVRLERTFI